MMSLIVRFLFLFSVFLSTAIISVGQNKHSNLQIAVFPYNNTDVGVSYSVMLQKSVGQKFYVNASIKYHQNTVFPPKIDDEKLSHRFYANNLFQHLGFSLGLRHDIKWKFSFVQPYIFYDLSYFNMDARTQSLPEDAEVNSNNYVPLVWVRYKDLHSFENALGLGLTSRITGNLYFTVRSAVSANIIFNLPESEYENGMHVNPFLQYSLGLQYNLKPR